MRSIYQSRTLTVILVFLDAVALSTLWFAAYYLRYKLNPVEHGQLVIPLITEPINPVEFYIKALIYLLPLWLIVFAYYDHYAHRKRISGLNELTRIFKASFVVLMGAFAIAFLRKDYSLGRAVVLIDVVFIFSYLYTSRTFLRWRKQAALRAGRGLEHTLIVGAGKTGQSVAKRTHAHPETGYEVVGFVDDDPEMKEQRVNGHPVLGTTAELKELIQRHHVEVVFIAIPNLPQDILLNLIVECEELNVSFYVVSHAFEVITDHSRLDVMAEIPVHHLPGGRMPWPQGATKRLMDLAIATPLLLASLPWMIVVGLLIRLTSKGSAIFSHERVGWRGRPFTLYKFRTMTIDTPPQEEAPTDHDDPRITTLGRLLRKFSLDEFPQLWNVILGQMSLVGPRPEMPFLVEEYEKWQRYRLTVKPGVTGLWQIIGRKSLPLELNLEYDLYYIKNQTLLLDLMIILKSIPAVLLGRGAY